jgi:hypothetical protein
MNRIKSGTCFRFFLPLVMTGIFSLIFAQQSQQPDSSTAGAHVDTTRTPVSPTMDTGKTNENVSIPNKTIDSVAVAPKQKQTGISFKQNWSFSLQCAVAGMVICDVDNDSLMETVIIYSNHLDVYRCKGTAFTKTAEYKAVRGTRFLSIDAADLNKNGIPELYITSCSASNSMISFVGEFSGKEFKILKKRIPYFLRVVSVNDTASILLGQELSNRGVEYGKIYRLKTTDYSVDEKIPFPNGHSVLSVSTVFNTNDSTLRYVCYNRKNRIELLNYLTYNEDLETSDQFGGNPAFLSLTVVNKADDENRTYLPLKTVCADIDNDNIKEIFAVKNYELMNGFFKNVKVFRKHHIEILSVADGFTAVSLWKTPKTEGFISDLSYGDYNNDGKKEMVAIKVLKNDATIFQKPLSEIIAFVKK